MPSGRPSMPDQPVPGGFVPRAAPGVSTIEMGDQVVLFDEEAGLLHELDPRASVLWRCFDGEVTLDALIAEVADAFEAPVDTVRHDLLALVGWLVEEHLLAGPGERAAAIPEPSLLDGSKEPAMPDPLVLADPPNP